MFQLLLIVECEINPNPLQLYLSDSMKVHACKSRREIRSLLTKKSIDIILIDVNQSITFILHTISIVQIEQNNIPVVVYGTLDNPEAIIEIMKKKIDNYMLKIKPFEEVKTYIVSRLHKKAAYQETSTKDSVYTTGDLVMCGTSQATKDMQNFIARCARTDVPIMLFGESGTGKNLMAQLIHMHSDRKGESFRYINCGAIPDTLIESELFGSEVGAFTGAVSKKGIFTRAHRGTLFLDELGNLSLLSQSKILHAIEEKKYTPLGSEKEFKTDVRYISATNKNIKELIHKDEFRLDLYYRMAILYYTIPPLRERKEDIIPLAWHFLRAKTSDKIFSDDAIDKMMTHSWPGNIRELHNSIIRASLLSDGDVITQSNILF